MDNQNTPVEEVITAQTESPTTEEVATEVVTDEVLTEEVGEEKVDGGEGAPE